MAVAPVSIPHPAADAPRSLIHSYPVAAFSLTGLALGGLLRLLHPPASPWIFAIIAVSGGLPLAWATARNMAAGRFYVDTIATLAIISAVVEREYLAGALVVLMQSGGEALEDYGLRRANRSLDNLLKRAPSIAHRREEGGSIDIPAANVQIGDLLLILPGDILPADGVIIEGRGNVDEAALTGEPVPLAKAPGDPVYSGTINLNGHFTVRTTSTAAESKYEQIVRMVQHAQGEKAPINRLANRFAPAFTLVTLALAGGAFALTQDSLRALSILVVATPCPLIIATPLAVLSAINRAAALNIIVKSGTAIEQAGAVITVVFDKTGTLTSGTPTLQEVRCFHIDHGTPEEAEQAQRELLLQTASVEMMCSHVLAQAVVQEARRQSLPLTPASEMHEAPGTGVRGFVQGHRITIGAGSFLCSEGVLVGEAEKAERARLCATGKTVAYVGRDTQLVGLLIFADAIRPEAPTLIQRLRTMGLSRTTMLTGDAPETARAVAEQLGIQDVRSRLQPEDKLAAIEALAREQTIMMVGDGINDAPALARAHVGVAMGSFGTGVATDAADIVITVENVERVADVIQLGRRMVQVAVQGIVLGLGGSLILMIIASLGYIPPAVGALLQEALDLAAILNAFRAR